MFVFRVPAIAAGGGRFCNKLLYKKSCSRGKMVVPDGVVGDWDLTRFTPEIISKETLALIDNTKNLVERIAAVPMESVCYENVVKPLEFMYRDFTTLSHVLDMPQHCVDDKEVRDASTKAEELLEEFQVNVNMRKDIFDRILKVQGTDMQNVNDQQKRFLERLIIKGKRCGLHLSNDVIEQVKAIKTKMSELSIKFAANLNEDNTKVYFKKEELEGLPEDLMNEFPQREDGTLEVTIKYNHLFPVLKNCRVPDSRKIMLTASNKKCMENNTPILEELIKLRHQKAQLLGFSTHAAYILDDRMPKVPEKVQDFLLDLRSKLQILADAESQVMMELKAKECDELGLPFDNKLNLWDFRYYMDRVEQEKYAVDHMKLREYFPLPKVLSGMFDIYQGLLGVTFTLVEDASVWHKEVNMYRVADTESGILLGYFFLDLHPRVGKHSHASMFPLQPACCIDGKRQVAVCALLCNFSKPGPEKPALLEHSEVETLFHEFGHAMHEICSRVDIAMLSGCSVTRDFLEAPSQMLENWVWEKETLSLMSEHYKTKEPIPEELLAKLVASRLANAGLVNLRQVAFSLFDQAIHSVESADTASLFEKIFEDVTGFKSIPDTNMPASFGHLGSGYDAQYYGYLWSEVFSMDMYETRFKDHVLDNTVGKDYRRIILERGNTVDALDLLKEFLGREPNNLAFLRRKGLLC